MAIVWVAAPPLITKAWAPPPGEGGPYYYPYSASGCPAEYHSRIDPVTVIFYGSATVATTPNHVRNHAGWWWQGGGWSSQYLSAGGVCGPHHEENPASDFFGDSRYHIRQRQAPDNDPYWGMTVMGTPHYEQSVACGHAITPGGADIGQWSGFDSERHRIYTALLNYHSWAGTSYWGNTQRMQQCNGWWAGADGNVAWWHIPGSFH